MTAAVESLIDEYARRYGARDVDGVTELCLCPFLAIREGAAIHLADRAAVHDHFATIIDAYRDVAMPAERHARGRDRLAVAQVVRSGQVGRLGTGCADRRSPRAALSGSRGYASSSRR